ncbi:hypothetical protein TL16_g00224 [Triparma laevis f. inornata]|uniref:Methyltransferase domain-containing protein n=1 Tax=Triparma laevis f. inornata TaxID=1714386 RepID=A0A9W6ZCN9_9STRA|nr:hypothetical protein TL16_g00224 [Triparma laevis f. inornata]
MEGAVLPPFHTTAEYWHENVQAYISSHSLDHSTYTDLRDAVISRLPAAALDGPGSIGLTRTDLISTLSTWRSKSTSRKINYLEIGCAGGENFTPMSESPIIDIAHCVDPDPKSVSTHKMTSSNFFKTNIQNYDIIFVDGLHQWSTALSDIASSLLTLSPEGVIIVHDSNPRTSSAASPTVPNFEVDKVAWNGDVYKAIVELGSNPNVDVATGYFDEGCAVVIDRPRSKERLLVPREGAAEVLSYEVFDRNRKEFLNLLDWEELMYWIEGEAQPVKN